MTEIQFQNNIFVIKYYAIHNSLCIIKHWPRGWLLYQEVQKIKSNKTQDRIQELYVHVYVCS